MAANLKNIRAEIVKLQREYSQIERAAPPIEENEARLRYHLETMANAHGRLVEYAAFCLNSGSVSELTPLSVLLPEQAYGLAVRALGVDQIIAEAKERAAKEDSGLLRLSKGDKEEKLLAIAHELYALEAEEFGLLAGEGPRADMNAAAAVGIPANVAEEFGLLKARL